jgi:hypothetical protein
MRTVPTAPPVAFVGPALDAGLGEGVDDAVFAGPADVVHGVGQGKHVKPLVDSVSLGQDLIYQGLHHVAGPNSLLWREVGKK